MDHTSPNPLDSPDSLDLEREGRLWAWLEALPGLAVAFSGGVDSSYLLAVAQDARSSGDVRVFLGVSPSLSRDQRQQARRMARTLGVRLEELRTEELASTGYRRNAGDRCYFCKQTLFSTIRTRLSGETLVDGTNLDDLQQHRPGRRAAREAEVRSPLAEVGLGKAAIRRLSRRRGLETWAAPAAPCLASRVPAGLPVSEPALRQIETAERILRRHGFREFRVRHHGELARIELPPAEQRLLSGTGLGGAVAEELRALGFRFVTLDLQGFRSGSSSLPAGQEPS